MVDTLVMVGSCMSSRSRMFGSLYLQLACRRTLPYAEEAQSYNNGCVSVGAILQCTNVPPEQDTDWQGGGDIRMHQRRGEYA